MAERNFISELVYLENFTLKHWLVVFGLFAAVNSPIIFNNQSNSNLSVMQAESFLQGKLELNEFFWDVSEYEGKYFSPFPPLPALMSIPFVWLFGAEHVNVVAICIVISFLTIFGLIRIVQLLDVPREYRVWLVAGFLFGTGYWFTLITSHHVYGFAHVTCSALLLLSIVELLGKRRAFIIGLLVGAAFLCRQMTIFYSLFFGLYFLFTAKGTERFTKPLVFGLALVPFLAFYLCLNYFRFHNPLDTGYAYLDYIPMFQSRVDQYGLFNTHYLLHNLYSLFIKGPNIIFEGTDKLTIQSSDMMGTSLTMASPFLFLSLKANCDRVLKICGWLCIGVVMIGGLLYFNNGFEQVNTMRFSLDFIPLLFVFVCYGCTTIPQWLFRNIVLYSIILNVILFTVHILYQ